VGFTYIIIVNSSTKKERERECNHHWSKCIVEVWSSVFSVGVSIFCSFETIQTTCESLCNY
jgi:hypothetical protein